MVHRHLDHENYTPAAIDDVISRGKRSDWEAMRDQIGVDPALPDHIRRVCLAYTHDPYAQRYHFWLRYVESR